MRIKTSRLLKAGVALAIAMMLLIMARKGSLAANGTALVVTNQSDTTICKIYITPNINLGLRGEQLVGGKMKQWARRVFTVAPGQYDLMAMDCSNRAVARWNNANLTRTQNWAITNQSKGQAIVVSTNDHDWDGIPDSVDECRGVKETRNGIFDGDGCPDTIDDLLQFAIRDVGSYWQRVFSNSSLTYRGPTNVDLEWRSDYLAFYNSGKHSISVSRVFATEAVNEIGDFAPVVAVAHEWGHLVQSNLGILGVGHSTKTLELQADCFAGAYTRDAESRDILDSDDAQEGAQLLISLGDDLPVDHPSAHGNGNERATAYQKGYLNGPRPCMSYTAR